MDIFRTMQLAGLLTDDKLVEAREEFVASSMGNKILAAYKNDSGQKPQFTSALEIIHYLSRHISHQYIQWLAKQYAAGQYRLEDVNRMKKEIDEFNKIKPKLVNKDINSYANLATLYAELNKYQSVDISTKKQHERSVKMHGAKKIIDTPHFKVVIPMTQESACYYGKGTRWCTSADEDNKFDHYTKDDVLYIILAGDRKFQLSMKHDQFSNEQDLDLTKADIAYLSKYPEYKEFLNSLIKKYYID